MCIVNKQIAVYPASRVVHRDFWVSWEGGNVKVGRGYIYGQQLIVEAALTGVR